MRPTERLAVAVFLLCSISLVVAGPGRGPERTGPPLPQPVTDADYYARDAAKEALGRLLFFDKILSGNDNISCATCHHPFAATADALSLPVGEGATGLGTTRNTGHGADAIVERVPRNAPAVFNLGAREFTTLFHDGRVAVDESQPSGFLSPAGADLPPGLDHVFAVQAMFPVTSLTEMAGQAGENPIADAAAVGQLAGPGGVWQRIALKLQAIPQYVTLFSAAFDDVSTAADITYVHAANAIAAFEAAAWRADDSPFDRYLRGDKEAMGPAAKRGMRLFYGRAGCDACHSGAFQTDHGFHAVGMPQIGPGKGDNLTGYLDGHDDFGRERVTGDEGDRFRFRTPSLRNVALTGPWGHAGAYNSLEAVVRHELDRQAGLEGYDRGQALLPPRPDLDAVDFLCHQDPVRRTAIAERIEGGPVELAEREVDDLLAFLHALTDRRAFDLRNDVPMRVPSGIPVAE